MVRVLWLYEDTKEGQIDDVRQCGSQELQYGFQQY